MKIGFTGSRQGIKTCQLHTFKSWIIRHIDEIEEFHHGCCIGADTFVNNIVYELNIPIIFHPPINTDQMSDLTDFDGTWRDSQDYLTRNELIVDESNFLIAMPNTFKEILRSGTWATIRYARKNNVPGIIINPAGKELELTTYPSEG